MKQHLILAYLEGCQEVPYYRHVSITECKFKGSICTVSFHYEDGQGFQQTTTLEVDMWDVMAFIYDKLTDL